MENRASHFSARHSISRRFSYALIGVVTVTLFSFAAIVISINLSRVNTDLKIRLDDTLALAQKSLVEPLWNFDQNTVDRFVEALFLDESVVYVKISDDTQVISTRIRAPFENKDVSYFEQASQFIVQSSHIYHEGNRIGTVQLAMSRDSFKEALVSNIQSIIVLTVLIIISISLTSIFISRRYISRPLSKLQHSAALIANGDLDAFLMDLGDATKITAVISENFNAVELLGLRELMLNRDLKRIDEYEKIWRAQHGEPVIPDFVHGQRPKSENKYAFHSSPSQTIQLPSTHPN